VSDWGNILSANRACCRERLARRFLRGAGIELGALHCPLWVPRGVRVQYVDRMPVEDLRRQYPELNQLTLAPVDVVDNGETLTSFEMESQDFIIANHFLEHTENPIGTVRRHLEILRPGGILYLAVPEKNWTFDRLRPETDFAHLLRDDVDGPDWSRDQHFNEFASLVMQVEPAEVDGVASRLKSQNYSIHFHVWSAQSFRSFITTLISDLRFPMRTEAIVENQSCAEIICVLRKSGISRRALKFWPFWQGE
jgi:hypothetical protein